MRKRQHGRLVTLEFCSAHVAAVELRAFGSFLCMGYLRILSGLFRHQEFRVVTDYPNKVLTLFLNVQFGLMPYFCWRPTSVFLFNWSRKKRIKKGGWSILNPPKAQKKKRERERPELLPDVPAPPHFSVSQKFPH